MTMPAPGMTAYCEAVLDEIERVVVGKRAALTLILTTVLAGGHVLIEDLPGMGKTLIARSFASALACASPGCSSPRPVARRSARLHDLRHAVGPIRVPPWPDLHQPADGRRDQPDAPQDPSPHCWRRWPSGR